MDWSALLDPTVVPQYFAALLMYALAGGLLWSNFGGRVNRAFALFLFLRATTLVLATTANVLNEPEPPIPYLWRVNFYFVLGMFPALVYFVALYPAPRGWLGRRSIGPWVALGAALVLEGLYILDPCSYYCYAPGSTRMSLGPLAFLASLFYFALSAVGLVLILDYTRAKTGPKRDALFLVGAIFVLNGLVDGANELTRLGFDLANPASGPSAFLAGGLDPAVLNWAPTAWVLPSFLAGYLAFWPALAAVIYVVVHWSRKPDGRPRRRRIFLVSALVAALSGVLIATLRENGVAGAYIFQGLWRVSIPLVCTYAILRHQLFDIDIRLKGTVKRGSVAAAFLLVFFVVSEGVESLVSDQVGTIAGFAAAGFLAFGLRPIERAASRFAEAMMPSVSASSNHVAVRKAEVYRAALETVLVDGRVTDEERAVLARLRTKLGLSAEESSRVEQAVGYAPM